MPSKTSKGALQSTTALLLRLPSPHEQCPPNTSESARTPTAGTVTYRKPPPPLPAPLVLTVPYARLQHTSLALEFRSCGSLAPDCFWRGTSPAYDPTSSAGILIRGWFSLHLQECVPAVYIRCPRRTSRLIPSVPNLPDLQPAFRRMDRGDGSERMTGALLDRLIHHVHILEMNGDSFRLKQSKKRRRSPSSG